MADSSSLEVTRLSHSIVQPYPNPLVAAGVALVIRIHQAKMAQRDGERIRLEGQCIAAAWVSKSMAEPLFLWHARYKI
jgi:hypothetical protein